MGKDVIDANKQQVKKIEEKDTTVSDLKKEKVELQAQLCIETNDKNAFKDCYEQLVKSLKNHDYGKC